MTVVIEAQNVTRHFVVGGRQLPWRSKRILRAVDGVSLTLNHGDSLGLVGESGSGKSTLAQVLLGLVAPTNGQVLFQQEPIAAVDTAEWRKLRRRMQLVHQDPLGALNPRLPIGYQIEEALVIHGIGSAEERAAKLNEILDAVHLGPSHARRYPYELSGGQRQRVVIARALVLEPELIVCDEPVSALDVSIQAQIVNLLAKLRKQLNLTMVFISHDLRIVRHVCDQIAVMYLGKIIEIGGRDSLFRSPLHPYSQALISAVPDVRATSSKRKTVRLPGEPPSPIDIPSGCRFRNRCGRATDLCAQHEPELKQSGDQAVACHHPGPEDKRVSA